MECGAGAGETAREELLSPLPPVEEPYAAARDLDSSIKGYWRIPKSWYEP